MKNLYTAKVQVTDGREGLATSSDGHLSIKLGFPKELGGAGDEANPEQLFIAGYAACFGTTIKVLAGERSVQPGPINIEAEGTLSIRNDGTYTISQVTLTVIAPELGVNGPALIEDAKRYCAYSNATRGNVHTTVSLA